MFTSLFIRNKLDKQSEFPIYFWYVYVFCFSFYTVYKSNTSKVLFT